MNKIEFFKDIIEEYEELLRELENENAPIDAIELVKESIRSNKILLENCILREEETKALEVAEDSAPKEDSGLTVGVYKNFKAFCIAGGKLEVDAKTPKGDTRKALIKQMDSLCSWRKAEKGNAIIVDEVYQFEKDIEDGRSKKSIYIDSAEALIIHNLKKSTNSVTFVTVGNLGEYVGLFNDKYQYADHDTLKVDFTIFNSFKRTTNAEAKRILDRCLKAMENRKLIDSAYTRIIVCKGGELRGANVEEKKIILDAEGKIMKNLGCLNFTQVKNRKLLGLFNEKVKEEVNSNGIEEFESSFKGYEIVSTKKLVAEAEKQLATLDKKQELNGLFIDKLNSTFEQKHVHSKNKQLETKGFGEVILEYEGSEEYKPTVNKLIDELIKLK
ncbi:MAG: hypothetical protein ACLSXJ_07965 [Clostridium saudiense]|uniref:hypothetical protein n=1 Tax=Clostridium saudiense TaxID=1414720 RepID=UPI0018A9767C|nr:hypothetical protein [Clostridium saudiense]